MLQNITCALFSKSLFVHPAVNGYLVLLRADEGSEGEEWRPTLVTLLPVQVDSLTATPPQISLG